MFKIVTSLQEVSFQKYELRQDAMGHWALYFALLNKSDYECLIRSPLK